MLCPYRTQLCHLCRRRKINGINGRMQVSCPEDLDLYLQMWGKLRRHAWSSSCVPRSNKWVRMPLPNGVCAWVERFSNSWCPKFSRTLCCAGACCDKIRQNIDVLLLVTEMTWALPPFTCHSFTTSHSFGLHSLSTTEQFPLPKYYVPFTYCLSLPFI